MPRPTRSTARAKQRAGELRRKQTPEEAKLWSRLRRGQLGVAFRRQHAIGNYIVDFCAPIRKLIIELDGSQHLEQVQYDMERTAELESLGYRVIRFSNRDVNRDIESVLGEILRALKMEGS